MRALFEKAGKDSPSGTLWGHAVSEAAVYLDPYVEQAPETLLIAWDGEEPVGYLIGCIDSAWLPGEEERLRRAIKDYGLMRHLPAVGFFLRAMLDMIVASLRRKPLAGDFTDLRWPSHLHINVLPEARSAGAGAALMDQWLAILREAGSPGCYLQTLAENEGAIRFFTRFGFRSFGGPVLVPGVRYKGRRVHQVTMVLTLEGDGGA